MPMRSFVLGLLVVAGLGCRSDPDFASSVAGTWTFQTMNANQTLCLPDGLLNDGDGLSDDVFTVTQNGTSVFASFTDRAGNEVTFVGTYERGTLSGDFTIREPGGAVRQLGVRLTGVVGTAADGEVIVDGALEITSDDDGACIGVTMEFWASVGPVTQDPTPTAVTSPATNVAPTSATLNGSVNPNGAATTYSFEWGTTALDRTTPARSAGSGSTEMAVSADLSSLAPETTYQFRVVAETATTTVRGDILEFTTDVREAPIAFVGHGYREDVDVVDVDTMTVITTITAAGGYRMAITPDGRKLYGTTGDRELTVCDAVNFTLLDSFVPSVGEISVSELEPIAMSPDGSRVYVGDEQGDTAVFVIDTATDTVIAGASLSMDEPENAVVSPDGAFLYIVDNSDAVKIDTATLTIVGTFGVGSDAHGVAISQDGLHIYAEINGGVAAIRTDTMTQDGTALGAEGYYLETGAQGDWIYGVDEGRQLHVIDASAADPIPVVSVTFDDFLGARGITTTRDGSTILMATSRGLYKLDAETLDVLDTLEGSYQSVLVRPPLGGD